MKVPWEMSFYSKHPVTFVMIDISTDKEEMFLVRIIPPYKPYYRRRFEMENAAIISTLNLLDHNALCLPGSQLVG